MKRTLALLLIALFSIQSFAGSNNGIKEAFDELTYSLSVDWDQQDMNFYETQKEIFAARLAKLKEGGATNEEIIFEATSTIQNKLFATDIQELMILVSRGSLSEENFSQTLLSLRDHQYSQGVSWNGRATLITSIAVLVIAAAAMISNPYFVNNELAGEMID